MQAINGNFTQTDIDELEAKLTYFEMLYGLEPKEEYKQEIKKIKKKIEEIIGANE